jgi:hypothetical protein
MKIKDLDKEIVKEMISAGSIAGSTGGGNGFVNGGPGTLSRAGTTKKNKKKKIKR